MADILFVTLARGGSKGVPDKHIRMLGDKPVIAWTIQAVKKSKHEGDYVVSSDSEEILKIVRRYKVHSLDRPGELALDTTPTIDALQHAVRHMEVINQKPYKYVIEVRATSPFKTTEDIDEAVTVLIERHLDSVIGVTQLEDHHPARAKWLDGDGYIRDFINEPESGRRQDCLPKAYIRNGTVYALSRDAVMVQGRIFGHKRSMGMVMPEERSINIDSELDWKMCKLIVSERSA